MPTSGYDYKGKTLCPYEDAANALKLRLLRQQPDRIIKDGYPDIYSELNIAKIMSELLDNGITCQIVNNSLSPFKAYLDIACYPKTYYPDNIYEKAYEHFWSLQLLSPYLGGTFIDIASECSPLSDIAMHLYGGEWFSQDIMYEKGVNGNRIGCSVESMPFEDETVAGACATCSIEHFEGNIDTLFFKEMERILKPGGKLIIAPFYIAASPFTITHPCYSVDNVEFDVDGEIRLIRTWENRHGRFYSPKTTMSRIVNNCAMLKFKILLVDNFSAIDSSVYCRFILVAEKRSDL